jgi:serine/threonine-protein kinase
MQTEAMRLVDHLCDEYEACWRSGQTPQLESFLERAPPAARKELFQQLLALEVEYRRDLGQAPSVDEYVARFPEFADLIRRGHPFRERSDTRPRSRGRHSTNLGPRPASQATSDRNLLFGILAVQMDFITRDQLIAGMNAWLLSKAKPLGEILCGQGVISGELVALIEKLAEKHIEAHGNDAEKSLASVGAAASLKDHLARVEDPDVETSVGHLAGWNRQKEIVPTLPPGEASTLGQRFRVVRPHAKGGIGEILVAEDLELSRTVALKQIQPRHADNPDARARFLLEAEITGSLEHPGIVPVYGLGSYPDGRPFYAMRFIRGASLKEAIEEFYGPAAATDGATHAKAGHVQGRAFPISGERALEFRKLLTRFVAVCHAVQYAHSRGVVHRDLKPGNIMLGKFGEALVVDWGLAKSRKRGDLETDSLESTLHPARESNATPTRFGSVLGTPGYMPPEQATGRLNELGPASDVYSLGATLFHLLTGAPPFQDSDGSSALRKAQTGSFPHPRELNAAIPKALEAICLKAMSREPRDRYEGPMALAGDIEQWLADEPVSAWQEPRVEQVRRWMRRHSSLVTGVVSAMLVGLAIISVAAVLLNDARRREQNAKDAADRNFIAAEANFLRAQSAVDEFYTQVSEETLLNQPGMQPLRRNLLTQALEYYEEFLSQRGDDPRLQAEVALAHFRVGEIRREMESPDRAISSYERALAIQETLVAANEDDLANVLALSDTWNSIGRVSHNEEQALEGYEQALSLRKKLVDAEPENAEYQRKLASSRMNVGIATYRLGRKDEAYEEINAAQEIRLAQLARAEDVRVRRDLGMGYYNLAVFALTSDDGVAGENHLLAAIEAFRVVLDAEPHDLLNQQRLAQCYRLLADRRLKAPNYEQAADAFERARALLEMLALRNPEMPEFQMSLASVHMDLSEVHRLQGQIDAALRAAEEAVGIFVVLAAAGDPASPQRFNHAVALHKLGSLRLERGERELAAPLLEDAHQRLQQLAMDFPQDQDVAKELAEAEKSLQRLQARDGAQP